MIRVDVEGSRELKQLAKKLRRAAGGRPGRLAGQKIVAATPAVKRRVQTAVRSVEVGSTRGGTARPDSSTALRARAAAAVEHSPSGTGATIFVAGWKLGVNGTRLAQYLDTEDLPRWRHPVFGHTTRWVTQTGQPWFYVTIRAADEHYANAVDAAGDIIVREICS